MRHHFLNSTLDRYQRLADHLTTENPLPSDLGTIAAKQIMFQRFETKSFEKRF